MMNDMMFCRECAAKIQRDGKFCRECGASQLARPAATVTAATSAPAPIQWIESAVAVEKPKAERRMPKRKIALVAITLAVIFIILATPWIPVVKPYQQVEQFPYSYEVTEKSEVPHKEIVFSSGTVSVNPYFYSVRETSEDLYWESKTFHLEKGWNEVVLNTSGYEVLEGTSSMTVAVLEQPSSDYTFFSIDTFYISAKDNGSFTVPHSGNFYVQITNYGLQTHQPHNASVEMTAEWTEVRFEQRTVNAIATFEVTMYNVTYVSPIDLMLRRM
jgi:hypothetical protein